LPSSDWRFQVRDFEESKYKARSSQCPRASASAVAKKTSWLIIFLPARIRGRDDLLRGRLLRREFHRLRPRGLGARLPLQRLGIEIVYEPLAVNYHVKTLRTGIKRKKCASRTFDRALLSQAPARNIMLNLGMTPYRFGRTLRLHGCRFCSAPSRGARNARGSRGELLLQYHYVSGIKEARDEEISFRGRLRAADAGKTVELCGWIIAVAINGG